MVEPSSFISTRNGFAMTLRDFISHLMNVLDQLGMSMHARTAFIKFVAFRWFRHHLTFSLFPQQ
jgi:hypothetical protein